MRYVIRDTKTGKEYMDCFETIRGCVDRIREYQEEDKKNGCYKEYDVYDTIEEEFSVYGYELRDGDIEINGKKYIVTQEAYYEYRSHIDECPALEPNNWVAMRLTDGEKDYVAWYYVEDLDETDLHSDIDYYEPDSIEELPRL